MIEIYEIRFKYQENDTYKKISAYNDFNYALERMREMNAAYGDEEPFYVKKIIIGKG